MFQFSAEEEIAIRLLLDSHLPDFQPSYDQLLFVDQLLGIPINSFKPIPKSPSKKKSPFALQQNKAIQNQISPDLTCKHPLLSQLQENAKKLNFKEGRKEELERQYPSLIDQSIHIPKTICDSPVPIQRITKYKIGSFTAFTLISNSQFNKDVQYQPFCLGTTAGYLILYGKTSPVVQQIDQTSIVHLISNQNYLCVGVGKRIIIYSIKANNVAALKTVDLQSHLNLRRGDFWPGSNRFSMASANSLHYISIQKNIFFISVKAEEFKQPHLLDFLPLVIERQKQSFNLQLQVTQYLFAIRFVFPVSGIGFSSTQLRNKTITKLTYYSLNKQTQAYIFISSFDTVEMFILEGLKIFPLKAEVSRLGNYKHREPIFQICAMTREQVLLISYESTLLDTYNFKQEETQVNLSQQKLPNFNFVFPNFCSRKQGLIYRLSDSQVHAIKQLSLQEYVQRMIEKDNFKQLLNILLRACSGAFFGFNFKYQIIQFKKLFKTVVTLYTKQIVKLPDDSMRVRLSWIVEFLTLTHCSQLIDSHLSPLLEEVDRRRLLFDVLQRHLYIGIQLNDSLYSELMIYLQTQKRIQSLNQLFNKQNLHQVNLNIILPILSQLGLHLIQLKLLGTNDQTNLSMGLVRLFGKIKLTLQPSNKLKLGSLFIAYFASLLLSENPLGQPLSQNLAFYLRKWFVVQLLSEGFLTQLLKLHCKPTLQLIYLFFSDPLTISWKSQLSELKHEYMKKQEREQFFDSDLFNINLKLLQHYSSADQRTVLNKILLSLDLIHSYMDNQTRARYLYNTFKSAQDQLIDFRTGRPIWSKDTVVIIIQRLFPFYKNYMKQRKQLFALLTDKVCRAYLLAAQSQFSKALETVLSSETPHQVFSLLQAVLNYMSQTGESTAVLLKLIKQKASSLCQLDASKFQQLIFEFGMPLLQIIEKTDQKIQLSILNMFIEKDRSSLLDSNEIKIAHLNLMCRLDPKRICYWLSRRNYPLDQTITVCTLFKNYQGLIILREKQGEVKEAHRLIFKLIDQNFNSLRQASEAANYLNKAGQLLKLCSDQSQLLEVWKGLLIQLMARRSRLPQLVNAIQQSMRTVFNMGVNKLQNREIVLFLDFNGKKMGWRVLRQCYSEFTQSLSLQFKKFMLVKDIHSVQFMEIQNRISNLRLRGLSSRGVCDSCGLDLGASRIFECNHSFHIECFLKQQCSICLLKNQVFKGEQTVIKKGVMKSAGLQRRAYNRKMKQWQVKISNLNEYIYLNI